MIPFPYQKRKKRRFPLINSGLLQNTMHPTQPTKTSPNHMLNINADPLSATSPTRFSFQLQLFILLPSSKKRTSHLTYFFSTKLSTQYINTKNLFSCHILIFSSISLSSKSFHFSSSSLSHATMADAQTQIESIRKWVIQHKLRTVGKFLNNFLLFLSVSCNFP